MFRFSGAYIYGLAVTLNAVRELSWESKPADVATILYAAIPELETFLSSQAFGVRSCIESGNRLLQAMKAVQSLPMADAHGNLRERFDPWEIANLPKGWADFDASLRAELAVANFYWVTPKGAFDPMILAERGENAFPSGLIAKVPSVEYDVKQAARCIAFDLPTAAAFHLHRVHEAAIHEYFKKVAPVGTKPPTMRALEHWLKAIEALPTHDNKLVAAMRDISNLHRNPVLHPDHTLTDVEDAIALLGAINTSLGTMLKAM